MDKQLKIFALEYIKEHDGLLKEERLALGQFVMEASDNQVKFMLLTGEVKDNLIEGEINFIEKNESILEFWILTDRDFAIVFGAGAYVGVAAAVFVAAASSLAFRAYKRYLSKAAKACKGKAGEERTSCLKKASREAKKQKIKLLEKGLSQCGKTKSPSQCKVKFREKITREKAQMGAL